MAIYGFGRNKSLVETMAKDEIESGISDVESSINYQASRITSVDNELTTAQSDISDIQGGLAGKMNKMEVMTVYASFSGITIEAGKSLTPVWEESDNHNVESLSIASNDSDVKVSKAGLMQVGMRVNLTDSQMEKDILFGFNLGGFQCDGCVNKITYASGTTVTRYVCATSPWIPLPANGTVTFLIKNPNDSDVPVSCLACINYIPLE